MKRILSLATIFAGLHFSAANAAPSNLQAIVEKLQQVLNDISEQGTRLTAVRSDPDLRTDTRECAAEIFKVNSSVEDAVTRSRHDFLQASDMPAALSKTFIDLGINTTRRALAPFLRTSADNLMDFEPHCASKRILDISERTISLYRQTADYLESLETGSH